MKNLLRKWLDIDEESRIIREKLVELIHRVEELEKQSKYLISNESAIPHNSRLEFILGAIQAFEKKLGRVHWNWKDDPSVLPAPHPKIRDWFITKKK